MIEIFLFWAVKMRDELAISAHILKGVKNNPFLRAQLRAKDSYFQLMGFSRFYLKHTCTKI